MAIMCILTENKKTSDLPYRMFVILICQVRSGLQDALFRKSWNDIGEVNDSMIMIWVRVVGR